MTTIDGFILVNYGTGNSNVPYSVLAQLEICMHVLYPEQAALLLYSLKFSLTVGVGVV